MCKPLSIDTYGAYTEGPEAVLVNLRGQIDRGIRKLDDPSDLRFVLFCIDYILGKGSRS
jgi:hypothetical protein